MKNKFKLGFIFILTIITGLVLIACDNGDDTLDKALTNLTVETILGDNESKDAITKDLALPTKDGEVVITWDSNKPAVITAAGKVIRQDADETIRLTATLSYDGAEEDKHFDLVVLKADGEVVPDEEFTVTFNSDGGTSVESQTVEEGAKATKPANPTKAGFKFLGWFLGVVEFEFDTAITADITLVAKWEENAGEPGETIAEVRELSEGTETEFVGVVTGFTDYSEQYSNFDKVFIEDSTAAIVVYQAGFPQDLKVGDRYKVTGKLDSYNGLIQIARGATVEKLESDIELIAPVEVTDLTEIDESYQGKRVDLEGTVVSVSSTGQSLVVKVGENQITVRSNSNSADHTVNSHLLNATVGQVVKLHGIHVDWFNSSQLIPTLVEQVEFVMPSDEELAQLVLDAIVNEWENKSFNMGTDATLPQTGDHDSTITWTFASEGIIVEGKWSDVTADTTYSVTVVVTIGDEEVSKVFDITVKFVDGEVAESTTVIAKYPVGTTGNMVEGSNNAEALDLDPSIFNVTNKTGSPQNAIGLNKDGSIRLYANRTDGEGNTLEISTLGGQIITSIKITYLAGSNTVEGETSGLITFGNDEGIVLQLADIRNTTKEYTGLNVESFTIKNTTTGDKNGQIWISEIQITFSESTGTPVDPVDPVDPEPVVEYTVKFNTNGGNEIADIKVEEGTTIKSLPTPTKLGFDFKGWFTEEELTNEFDLETEITEDITLYAKWEVIEEDEEPSETDDEIFEISINYSGEQIKTDIDTGDITNNLTINKSNEVTISVEYVKGTGANTIFNNSSGEIRLYVNGELNIKVGDDFEIVSVEFNTSRNNGVLVNDLEFTNLDVNVFFDNSVNEVNIKANGAQVRIDTITITYKVK